MTDRELLEEIEATLSSALDDGDGGWVGNAALPQIVNTILSKVQVHLNEEAVTQYLPAGIAQTGSIVFTPVSGPCIPFCQRDGDGPEDHQAVRFCKDSPDDFCDSCGKHIPGLSWAKDEPRG